MSWGVAGVTHRYGRGAAALTDVSLQVEQGRITAVVGGDGAGKTTLLKILLGTLRASAGTVSRPPRERTSAVVASGGVYGDLTVDENMGFVADAYSLGSDAGDRGEMLLRRAGLLEARTRLAANLSGGMRQKLALALALLPRPDLLVLDEPTTGVDPVSRAELWLLLTSAAAEGAAVVFSTTYLEEAERAAQLLVLDEGRVLAAGTTDQVLASMPGRLGTVAERPRSGHAWRHGLGWRTWDPVAPHGPVAPRLEDVIIVAQLRQRAAAS